MIERLRFAGVTGEPLAGVFHRPTPTDPDTGVRGGLLVVHCFTCSKDLLIMSRLARAVACLSERAPGRSGWSATAWAGRPACWPPASWRRCARWR